MRKRHQNRMKPFYGLIVFFTLLLTAGCSSVGGSKPNSPYDGPYPDFFNALASGNPVLAEEIGRLPEIRDGLSDSETRALKELADMYQSDPEAFNRSFEQMNRVGLPQVRKYCSPLQAVFWLAMDGRLQDNRKTILEKYFLAGLLLLSWNTYDDRWQDFDTVMDRLNSPDLIDYYLRNTVTYKYERGHGDSMREAYVVFKNRYGHCAQITAFAVYTLRRAGYKASRLTIDHPAYTSPKGNPHRVCLFEVNGKQFVMDNGRSQPLGIVPYEDYNIEANPLLYEKGI